MSFIQINNLSIGYDKILVSDINLSANLGEVIAIIGLNGIGKSTLLKTIAKIISTKNGEILIDKENLAHINRNKISHLIGFSAVHEVFSNEITIYDYVSLGRIPHSTMLGNLSKTDISIIEESIKNAGLDDKKNKKLSQSSDGEKQRSHIARLIAQQTKILLFDEPTAFLDIGGKHLIISLFKNIVKNKDKIIIFSTHDLKIALQNSDKIWLFTNGQTEEGSPEDLILNNSFNNIFCEYNIFFDNFTADFYVNSGVNKSIKLSDFSDNNLAQHCTKNAMKRIGFEIQTNADIEIEIHNNNWIFKKNDVKLTFNNLYNLLNYFKNV
jgi:iron complex transport system ATP-binding protein